MTPDGKKHWTVMAPNNRYSDGEGIYLKNVKDITISDVCIKTTAEKYILENVENTYINGKKLG